MTIIKSTLKPGDKPAPEQIKMIEEAAKRPVEFDEDCPELTDEQIAEFREILRKRAEERKRQNVTLRLKPATIRKAKSLGKGYTSILSRILEYTLNDPEELSRFL